MRRIANILILVAAVAGLQACAADAPTNPGPGNGGGGGNTGALQVLLVASDANPKAGTCTLLQATVTLNGNTVPEGTSVSFSTDFGTFSQTGLPLASIVTSNGVAVTALCGPAAGSARVRATATSGGQTGSANVTVVFQPDSGTLPFVSSCSPSFGPKEGGTELTLNGGRFSGTPATTRVQFTVNGVTKDGIVQSVSANQIVVQTPGFPEFSAPQLQAEVRLSLVTNQAQPIVLSLPSCFSYGTQGSDTPTDLLAPAVLGNQRRRNAGHDRGLRFLDRERCPGLLRHARGPGDLGVVQPDRRALAAPGRGPGRGRRDGPQHWIGPHVEPR